jgi:hypothetical protein
MKILEEIIADGDLPEQVNDATHRTIIEILMNQRAVPLQGWARRYVALTLELAWIPRNELRKIYRQRKLKYLESLIRLGKATRKNKLWLKAGKVPPRSTALKATADASGFQSTPALKQFLKRERKAKKKPRR